MQVFTTTSTGVESANKVEDLVLENQVFERDVFAILASNTNMNTFFEIKVFKKLTTYLD